MRKLKDSGIEWIGEIPMDWNFTKIGALYDERNTKVSDRDYPALSVTKRGIVPQLETAAKTDNGDNRKLIKKNDFVINSRSDRRGSCGISEYDGSCSLINIVLRPRKNMYNAYYSYVFRSELFADEFYRWGNGIVDDLWSTKWSSMKNIYIPAPTLAEQKKIAYYLESKCSKIDEIMARQTAIVEKLKEYKISLYSEQIARGLGKEIALGKVIVSVEQGWSPSPSERKDDNGWSVLTLAAVKYGKFDAEGIKAFVGDWDNCRRFVLQNGDFLLTRSNTRELVGQVCMVDGVKENTIFSDLVYRLTFDLEYIDPEYALYYFQSPQMRQQISRDAHGSSSTMVKITHKNISNWTVMLPSIETQKEIVSILKQKEKAILNEISKRECLIKKLVEYKKSLIYEEIGRAHV